MSNPKVISLLLGAATVIEEQGFRPDEDGIHVPGVGVLGGLKVAAGYASDRNILTIPQPTRSLFYNCMFHLTNYIAHEDIWVWLRRQPADGKAVVRLLRDAADALGVS